MIIALLFTSNIIEVKMTDQNIRLANGIIVVGNNKTITKMISEMFNYKIRV
jgi:hypothetical protein